jgi:hypothetical protein
LKSRPEIPNKIVILTKRKFTSKVIKGISAEFKDRLVIAQVPSSFTDLVNSFQVEKFPAMFSIKDNEGGIGGFTQKYDGKMSLRSMKKFCEEFALPEKAELVETGPKDVKEMMTNLTKLNYEQETFYDERVVLVHIHKGERYHDLL